MSFYIRKSLRAGPFRFNLSKSGIGVSVGVPGFRVGMGPRGNYVHMGAGGIYYRTTLSPRPGQPGAADSRVPSAPAETGIGELRSIESGDVLQMTDSSSEDLLNEIRAKHNTMNVSRIAGCASALVIFLLLLGGSSGPAIWIAVLLAAISVAGGHYWDQIRKSVVLFYDLDPDASVRFEALHEGFSQLCSVRRTWHISAEGDVHDRKRNAGASSVVQRHAIHLTLAAPPFLKTNISVPAIPAGRQTLYFFPDRVLVYDRGNVGAVSYKDLRVRREPSRFIEDGGVPGDARVVDRTWRYVNKSGGPDRRFKDNREIPVCLYEQMHLSSASGLNELFQLSRLEAGRDLEVAVERLARSVLAGTQVPVAPKLRTAPERAAQPAHRPLVSLTPPAARTDVANEYYRLLNEMHAARTQRDYVSAIALARQSFPLLKPWIEREIREYGSFHVSSVPCLEIAGTLMAVMGEFAGLSEMRAVVTSVPELSGWIDAVDSHESDAVLVQRILAAVAAEPGIRQRDLKRHIGDTEGRRPSTLAEWLDKAGRIRREKDGSTYRLLPS